MADKRTYPMIPEKSWWAIREQFRKTIPNEVSVSYLKSLLSLTTDQAASNILYPLRQMKLVDKNNKPTDLASQWRSDSQYSKVCQKLVSELYPRELTDLFPDSSVDTKIAKDWFMNTAKIGSSAATKIIATFMLLKNGQIKTPSEKNAKLPVRNSSMQKKSIKKERSSTTNTHKNRDTPEVPISFIPTGAEHIGQSPSLHIDLQIHISPEASAEQIDSIFASVAKHLYDR